MIVRLRHRHEVVGVEEFTDLDLVLQRLLRTGPCLPARMSCSSSFSRIPCCQHSCYPPASQAASH